MFKNEKHLQMRNCNRSFSYHNTISYDNERHFSCSDPMLLSPCRCFIVCFYLIELYTFMNHLKVLLELSGFLLPAPNVKKKSVHIKAAPHYKEDFRKEYLATLSYNKVKEVGEGIQFFFNPSLSLFKYVHLLTF